MSKSKTDEKSINQPPVDEIDDEASVKEEISNIKQTLQSDAAHYKEVFTSSDKKGFF